MHLIWLVDFVIKLQLLYTPLYYATAVGCIIYCKCFWETQQLRLLPEEPYEDGVECTHPQLPGLGIPHCRGNSLLHLLGGLICKCKCQYIFRLMTMLQYICDTACEHSGFAGAGSCYNQRCTIYILNSLSLSWI